MGLKQVSFVKRSSLSKRVPYQRFHCILTLAHFAAFVDGEFGDRLSGRGHKRHLPRKAHALTAKMFFDFDNNLLNKLLLLLFKRKHAQQTH